MNFREDKIPLYKFNILYLFLLSKFDNLEQCIFMCRYCWWIKRDHFHLYIGLGFNSYYQNSQEHIDIHRHRSFLLRLHCFNKGFHLLHFGMLIHNYCLYSFRCINMHNFPLFPYRCHYFNMDYYQTQNPKEHILVRHHNSHLHTQHHKYTHNCRWFQLQFHEHRDFH